MTWPSKELNRKLYEPFSSAFERFDDVHYTLGTHNDKGRQLKADIKEYLDLLAVQSA